MAGNPDIPNLYAVSVDVVPKITDELSMSADTAIKKVLKEPKNLTLMLGETSVEMVNVYEDTFSEDQKAEMATALDQRAQVFNKEEAKRRTEGLDIADTWVENLIETAPDGPLFSINSLYLQDRTSHYVIRWESAKKACSLIIVTKSKKQVGELYNADGLSSSRINDRILGIAPHVAEASSHEGLNHKSPLRLSVSKNVTATMLGMFAGEKRKLPMEAITKLVEASNKNYGCADLDQARVDLANHFGYKHANTMVDDLTALGVQEIAALRPNPEGKEVLVIGWKTPYKADKQECVIKITEIPDSTLKKENLPD